MPQRDPMQDVVLERTYAAEPAVVWSMWADPDRFESWYGPGGASVSVTEMDVRAGGRRLLAMEVQTPEGARRMWFTGEYVEVVEPQRLAYTDAMCDERGSVVPPEQMGLPPGHPASTRVEVDLEATGEGTRLVLTHLGVPADSPGAVGWGMALDALGVRLAGLTGEQR